MSEEITLSEQQLDSLARKIAAAGHVCRFDEGESKTLHRFAQSLEGSWDKWQALLDCGSFVLEFRKTGTVVLVGALITAAVGALWIGIKTAIKA